MSEEEEFQRIIEEVAQDPVDGLYQELGADVFDAADTRQALASRDPDERAFLALVMCGAEIDNGGFEQLFGNSSDAIAQHGFEGATRFGLPGHAAIIKEAWDRWHESSPYDRVERDERLDDLDEEWYRLDDHLQRRLLEFVRVYRLGAA